MIAPNRFEFNGMSSLDFDVFTQFSFDSDSGEVSTGLDRDAILSETYNNAIRRGVNYKWSQTPEFKITLIRRDFSDFDESFNRRLLSWLVGKQTPGFLTLYADDSSVKSCEILGQFTSISHYKLGNSRVVGIVATFTSILPYPLSDIRTKEVKVDTPQTFTINCLTDMREDLVYPKITITHTNSKYVRADAALGSTFENGKAAPDGYVHGTVYAYNNKYWWVDTKTGLMIGSSTDTSGLNTTSIVIENLTTGTRTVCGGNVPGEVVTLDGANKVVGSSRPNGRVFGDGFNWNFMPLSYGENQIKTTGNCTIKFEFRYPLATGDFLPYFSGC